ncbi:MAG: hypothetical protein K8R02_09980 [Anaerohalosphaeraceae bacterium]|nr:hypothetical protein [Anaerohalosphaeraceae bacterium]
MNLSRYIFFIVPICIFTNFLLIDNCAIADANDCGQWGYAEMDLNEDCYVNMEDFAVFCDQWMLCSNPLDANCERLNKAVVVAHRGYSAIAPENTIAAFDACYGYADMVEFDVHSSLDSVLVVMHDETVDRTTNGTGLVSSFTLTELKALDAGSWFSSEFAGEQIPTLQESIEAILPAMTPCIERKAGTAQQYIDLLETMGVIDDVVIISFSESFLNDVLAINTDVKLGLLRNAAVDDPTLDSMIVRLKTNGIDILDWKHSNLDANDIKKIKSVGLEVYVWTVNDANTMEDLIDVGVEGITTDQPEIARTVVDQY